MVIFGVVFALSALVFLINSLYMFPNFYIKFIVNKKIINITFRIILVLLLAITQIWFYIKVLLSNGQYKDWHQWFYLEICNIVNWTAIFLLIFPNKLLLDCVLPLGIIGPILTVCLGWIGHDYTFSQYIYWQFYFGHITIIYSYLFLFTYGFTKSKFDKSLVKRSLNFTVILGLSIEIYNLAYGTNYILSDFIPAFPILQDKDSIYQFIFIVSWIFPILFALVYLYLWFFKPIYDIKECIRINDTWIEKTIKFIKKKSNKDKN